MTSNIKHGQEGGIIAVSNDFITDSPEFSCLTPCFQPGVVGDGGAGGRD